MSRKTQYIVVSYMYTDTEFNLIRADAELNYEIGAEGRVALESIRKAVFKRLNSIKEEDIIITSVTFLPLNDSFKYRATEKVIDGLLFGMGVVATIALVSIIMGLVK